jgi:Ca-activated chloride channel family protein
VLVRTRPILPLLLLLIAPVAIAQLVESIEVRITNVDVVVTDRSGKPIHGLTRDDFEVYENGKLQPLTNFYEMRDATAVDAVAAAETIAPAEAPPAELQRRRLVVFVDQESVDARRRQAAFASLQKTIGKLLRPDDEAMVVSFYRDRRVVTELTSDRAAIDKALREAATQAPGSSMRIKARDQVISNASDNISFARSNPRLMSMADAYRNAYATASAYADELYQSQKRLVAGVQQTVASMAGLEGKKVLIFIGGDLQARPGVDVFDAVDSMFRPTGVSVVNAANTTEGSRRSLGTELEKLGRDANTNGVTLYLIDATDRSSSKSAAEAAHIDENVGVDTGLDLESAVSMTALASATGGSALIGSANYDLALNNVARDLSSYYSLGYRASAGEGNRKIVVKVKKPGLVARSRRSYSLQSSEEEMNARVVANAFHPRISNEIPVTLQVGKAQPEGDVFKVPVMVKFPGDVTVIPDGSGSLAGEFSVYFVTASTAGNLSPVGKDVRPFKYPASQAKAIQSQPITYTSALKMRGGEQIVSVAVVDRLAGRSGFARIKFTVP